MSIDKKIKSSKALLAVCGGVVLVFGITLVLVWWQDVASLFRGFIGMALAEELANMGVKVVIEGTGNSDAAGEVEYTAVDYNNLVDFDLEFDPYDCDLLVGPKTMIGEILKLVEFKDPMVGFDYQKTGRWMTPLGKTLKRSGASELSTDKMLGLDSRFCLEKVVERGSSLTETDKIIDGQWDEIVISMVVGFAKTFTEAGKVWKPASISIPLLV